MSTKIRSAEQSYKIKQYYKNNYKKKLKKKSQSKLQLQKYDDKRYEDIIYRIVDNMTRRTQAVFVKAGVKRPLTHLELLGCSYEQLKEHLQSQFKPPMSYINYGEWEVDHIKPVSSFDLTNPKEAIQCFNYKNLQPLWRFDNRSKHNKH